MSPLLTALNAQLGNMVYIYTVGGTSLAGTLTAVTADLTACGSNTIDSSKIIAFAAFGV